MTIIFRSEIENILGELSTLGVRYVHFCGGEPFLRKDILDIIHFAKSKGFICDTVSNGYLIDNELARNIVLSGLDILDISIDSADRTLNDRIRGG